MKNLIDMSKDIVKITEILEEKCTYLMKYLNYELNYHHRVFENFSPIHVQCLKNIKTAYLLDIDYCGPRWINKDKIEFEIQEKLTL